MKYKKVLLTQFAIPNFYSLEYTSNVHLAPGYLVGYVQKDFPETEFIITPRVYTDLLTEEAFLNYAVSLKPDLILFSLYLWNIEKSLRIVKRLQKELPEAEFLFGGPEVNPDNSYLLESDQFTSGIVGEGEIAFRDYLAGKSKAEIAGFLTKDSYNDFKELRTDYSAETNPYLANIIETKPDDTMFFETVRGCPFNCSFCYYNKIYDKIIPVGFSHLEEIFAYARTHEFKELFILDPTFNVQPNFEKILNKLIELNSDHYFKISTELRADFLTDEQILKLKKINLVEAEIGLQTINDKALELMGRSKRVEETIERTKKMQEQGITCKVDLIIGLPGDNLASFKSSLNAVMEAGIQGAIQVFRLSILSGTEFSYKQKELGLIAQKIPPYYLESTPEFSTADIREAIDYTEEELEISLYPLPAYLLSKDFSNLSEPEFVEFDTEIKPIHKIIFDNLRLDSEYIKSISNSFCESMVLHFIVNNSNISDNEISQIIAWFIEQYPHNIYQFVLEFRDAVEAKIIDQIREVIPTDRTSYLNRDAIANLGVDLNLIASLAIIVPHSYLHDQNYETMNEQVDLFVRVEKFSNELITEHYDEANFFFVGNCQSEALEFLQSQDLIDDYTLFDSFQIEINKTEKKDQRLYYPNCVIF